jgi:hypothetical protein
MASSVLCALSSTRSRALHCVSVQLLAHGWLLCLPSCTIRVVGRVSVFLCAHASMLALLLVGCCLDVAVICGFVPCHSPCEQSSSEIWI